MKQQKLEQQEREQQMTYKMKVFLIGFFGGLIWSSIGYFTFFFHFIRIGPAFVLMPWILGDWKDTYIGQLVGILVISIVSIAIAFVYMLTLQKVKSMWVGVGFGLFLWVLIFYILNPFFPGLKTVPHLDSNTIVTSLCLFALYGLFIGYSISYEYAEQDFHKNHENSNDDPIEELLE
ncbi:hypothetical protein BTS2_0684 [Bacillus sp. TS-2]|nr:hypothetical protein BTS2_0684 [Bacillus sp. TS-2]